jgi:hypothetical protein
LLLRNIFPNSYFSAWCCFTVQVSLIFTSIIPVTFVVNIVQCWGLLDQFWPPIILCYSTEDAVRIVNSFISIPITRNYIHSQLFLKLLHMYAAYNHLYVRNYNHLFHSYTFTQFTCTTR